MQNPMGFRAPRLADGGYPLRPTLTQPTYNSTSTLASTAAGIPTIAIVGRPNVGKSTLFNRIVGSRRAIVGDEPGITRDRLYCDAEWEGRRPAHRRHRGHSSEEKDLIPSEIYRQARVALDEAAAIVMVIDGRTELAGPDSNWYACCARLTARSSWPSTRSTAKNNPRWSTIFIASASSRCSPFLPNTAAGSMICWTPC